MSIFHTIVALFLIQSALTTAAGTPVSLPPVVIREAAETLFNAQTPATGSFGVRQDTGKRAVTTVFWVGEKAGRENDYISNADSAWDRRWKEHFGGEDDSDDRCGYRPCDFVPDENPFYVALPYNDLTDDGERKASARDVPWFDSAHAEKGSILKNRWVAVTYRGTTCYGQWEDVGPGGEDDFAYVFGDAEKPTNTFGERAGLDISPALRDCFDANDVIETKWRFVERVDVPAGPWLTTITTR